MVLWWLLHFIIAAAGTWLARRYALHRELIDQPGERRSHAVPTPRGGGAAIVVALMVAAAALAWRQPQHIVLLTAFVIGLMLVAGVGLIDDHRPLSPWLRLGVQAIAASILAVGAAGTWGDLRIAVLAFVAVMVLTNVWNFMDGINGLAASQAALAAWALGAMAGGAWALLGLALCAACLGFLPFNFPRARIFLGDVGSGSLGFVLATLVTAALAAAPANGWLLLLPLSAFLVDASLTLIRRMARRERWWTPHTQHAYQRWAAAAGTHTIVTLAYAGWTAVACLLAVGLATNGTGRGALVLGWVMVATAAWGWLQYRGPGRQATLGTNLEKDRE
ncbi:MraY family glycosyltransferase [Agrilutibacter solisilvae]|uniref:Lipopolysaccharide biosynthesis protein n=1 Tax=Agrilutibacter solisilvae TaxID=2763317 RepID=A0A974XXT2_9GAMM|nr:lipopolysaccharide biosynthesis protein [Lysobacter solisilvae]QSX77736.1 lipopolysaccharide biosynthesis protein [Lysobacter solisilvae]